VNIGLGGACFGSFACRYVSC